MYFVFACCLIAILLAWLESRNILKNGLKCGFILITIISALRYGYGCDYFSYIDKFYDAARYDLKDLLSLDQEIREPGWLFLMKLFEPFGVYVAFGVLAIVTSYIYYHFIKENVSKQDYWLALSIYLLNFDLFVLQQSMIRQAFAMSLCVWGYRYIKEISQLLYSDASHYPIQTKAKKRAILKPFLKLTALLTVTSFIHQSSLVLIPVSLIAFLPLRKGKVLAGIMLIAFCFLWLSSRYIAPIFEQLMAIEAVAFYGEKYITDDGAQFGIRQVLSFIPYFVSLYYLGNQSTSSINKHLVIISMLGILVLPFAGLLQLIGRVAYYFDAFTVAAYPIVYRNIQNKYIRIALTSLFLLIYIYVWFNKSTNPVWEGTFIEYHTLFEIY